MASNRFVEPLERRQFLSLVVTAPTWHLTGRGTLVIEGTIWQDTVSVTRRGDRVRFSASNNEFPELRKGETFSASRVKRVLVRTGDGNDRVHVAYDLLERVTLEGGAGNDRIDGNAGSVLIGGGGNDRLFVPDPSPFYVDSIDPRANAEASISNWNGLAGPALLSGGAGNDTLIAAGRDSVVGGGGDDLAVQHILVRNNNMPDPVPDPQESFGPRASGIERFSIAIQHWPEWQLVINDRPA